MTTNRVLDYGSGKSVPSLPTVEQCITRVQETDYRLVHRSRGSYLFRSDKRPAHCRELWFSLRELRDTFRYGF